LLSPFTPGASGRLWTSLGILEGLDEQRLPAAGRWGGLAPGTTVSKGDPLFPRVEA